MKKIILIGFVFFFQFCFGQESGLLWEITGKKVKQPSYLFGTMHMIPKDDFLFPDELVNYLTATDVLVMEIGGLSEQMKAMPLMMLEEGTLFEMFKEEQLDSLFKYTEENLGYDEEKMRASFSKMKPLVLLQLFTKEQFGENPESYELSLEQIARKEKMEIMGLETIEQQIGFLDNLKQEDQVNMIMQTIRGNVDDSETRKLIDVYLTQDIGKIYEFTTTSSMNSEDFEEGMLTNRNKNWIKPIRKIVKKNKSFIAVGAAHLGGPNGVVQLLREKGYTLTPIKL